MIAIISNLHIMYRSFWLIVCCALGTTTYAGNVIFDLNGVCLDTSRYVAFKHIIKPLLMSPTHIIGTRLFLFSFLHSLKNAPQGEIISRDEQGNEMPYVMHALMIGKMNSAEIRTLIQEKLAQDTSYDPATKKLLQAMTDLIFIPEKLIATQILHEDAAQLVRTCKNRGHNVYILSNWGADSFDMMCEKYPDFFNLFDGIIISGQVKLAKPNPAIYEFLLNTFNLDPQDCIFLDDQQANVEAARACGIISVHITRTNYGLTSYIDLRTAKKCIRAWEKEHNFNPHQLTHHHI